MAGHLVYVRVRMVSMSPKWQKDTAVEVTKKLQASLYRSDGKARELINPLLIYSANTLGADTTLC